MTDPDFRLKYPIGLFERKEQFTAEELAEIISIIENSPAKYRELAAHLTDDDLTKTYRAGSWNVRQLIHHVADIQHLHYFRLKKALTEPDYESVTLIDMNAWVLTHDSLNDPIGSSLQILDGLTPRYVSLARSLNQDQLKISYFHAVRKIWFTQEQALSMSAWHLEHHLAHIRLALGL
jgi:hypothetical protein